MSPIWVAPIEVIEALARRYDISNRYADFEVCVRVAEDTVMARLVAGHLSSIASYLHYCQAEQYPLEVRDGAVPAAFWRDWKAAHEFDRESDWFVGDFRYEHGSDWTEEECWGKAFGVKLDATAFPGLELARPMESGEAISNHAAKGRKPANWWPDFAEELAVYIHEHGMPKTQEALISGVQTALVEQGKAEPSRAQIQPVIRALFVRLSEAGN